MLEDEWIIDVELQDLSDEIRCAYYNAIDARGNLNQMERDLNRYPNAAPEERLRIEAELDERSGYFAQNLETVKEILTQVSRKPQLSKPDEKAAPLIDSYHKETLGRAPDIIYLSQHRPRPDFTPENIHPGLRGNYEDLENYFRECEEQSDDGIDIGELALMNTLPISIGYTLRKSF